MLGLRSTWGAILLFLLLVCTAMVYFPGLQGGFLFDDYPNLEKLGSYGGVENWNNFKSFVFGGFSGPTGRPLSLVTFLLNDNDWPAAPGSFKQTNLLIHLLCGVMLCWASLRVLVFYGKSESSAIAPALLTAAFWLLHPMMVSTTLYVVQRMAQLSTLFVLVGIVAYLKARSRLLVSPLSAYFWMTASVGLSTVLATFSKENGVLLPMLVLVIELCRPLASAKEDVRFLRAWKLLCLWLPSLLVLGYLASRISLAADPWPNRPFNQVERLLSEARIVWEYLFHLFVPQIEGRGLYQDAYNISTGILTPWTTAPAVLGIFALLAFGVALRRVFPLACMAVLFFLAAHLIESTVIGLELYFEHRNYMAALFLFLPFSVALLSLRDRVRSNVAVAILALILGLLAWMTWQRAVLWSDTKKLELYWAYASPDSPRAANAVAANLVNAGRLEEAQAYLEDALVRRPDSALLSVRILLLLVYADVATPEDFSIAGRRLLVQSFDAQAVKGLRMLAEFARAENVAPLYKIETLRLLETVAQNEVYQSFPLFVRLSSYLRAGLLLSLNNPDAAYEEYLRALELYDDADAGLKMVSELANAGEFHFALLLLDRTNDVLERQPASTLLRAREVYEDEILRMRKLLEQDLEITR